MSSTSFSIASRTTRRLLQPGADTGTMPALRLPEADCENLRSLNSPLIIVLTVSSSSMLLRIYASNFIQKFRHTSLRQITNTLLPHGTACQHDQQAPNSPAPTAAGDTHHPGQKETPSTQEALSRACFAEASAGREHKDLQDRGKSCTVSTSAQTGEASAVLSDQRG